MSLALTGDGREPGRISPGVAVLALGRLEDTGAVLMNALIEARPLDIPKLLGIGKRIGIPVRREGSAGEAEGNVEDDERDRDGNDPREPKRRERGRGAVRVDRQKQCRGADDQVRVDREDR